MAKKYIYIYINKKWKTKKTKEKETERSSPWKERSPEDGQWKRFLPRHATGLGQGLSSLLTFLFTFCPLRLVWRQIVARFHVSSFRRKSTLIRKVGIFHTINPYNFITIFCSVIWFLSKRYKKIKNKSKKNIYVDRVYDVEIS